jgi:hypothetical protein
MPPGVLWIWLGLVSPAAEKVHFTDVLERSGIDYRNVSGEPEKRYILSSLGSGAALFDYDEDGDLDLYLVNGARLVEGKQVSAGPSRLYRNEGDFVFRDVTLVAGVGFEGWGTGCAVGDYDNDGHPDLFVSAIGANVLYRNLGDGTFVEVSSRSGLNQTGFGASAAFFDAEGDGDLDLYLTRYVDPDLSRILTPGSPGGCRWFELEVFCGPNGLRALPDSFYRNEGDGSFAEATRAAGFSEPGPAYGLGVVVGDYDDDGDPDVYVANDSVPNFLFQNDGRGFFSEVGLLSGVAYSGDGLAQAGMGVDIGDLDGDGLLDFFVTNFSHDSNTPYRNRGRGLFADVTSEANLRLASWYYMGWATRFADLDNDGDEDLFVVNGHVYPEVDRADLKTNYRQPNQVFWNRGDGRFDEARFPQGDALTKTASGRGGAFGDIDNDGDVDAVIVNIDDRPTLLQNELPGRGNWLGLRLIGRAGNREAIGARVTLRAGSRSQVKEVHSSGSYLSSSDPRLHFGLANQERVDELVIRWPGGSSQKLTGIAAKQHLTLLEPR